MERQEFLLFSLTVGRDGSGKKKSPFGILTNPLAFIMIHLNRTRRFRGNQIGTPELEHLDIRQSWAAIFTSIIYTCSRKDRHFKVNNVLTRAGIC